MIWQRLRTWLKPQPVAPELRAARQLLTAIDAGGVPLNPARVNAIARDLGLEVSRKAAVEDTITRIRAAVARAEMHIRRV